MQFSLRYNEEIWELTDHEIEVTILAIHWEITAKFHMIPIDYSGFRSFVYSKFRLLMHERWKRVCKVVHLTVCNGFEFWDYFCKQHIVLNHVF